MGFWSISQRSHQPLHHNLRKVTLRRLRKEPKPQKQRNYEDAKDEITRLKTKPSG